MSQILHRLFLPIRRVKVIDPKQARQAIVAERWVSPIGKPSSMLEPDSFRLLNKTITLAAANGWNDETVDKLLLYNLHYMDDLTATDAASRANWHKALIDLWIEQNPPLIGNGWEPYTLSLRIVNWIKWSLAGNKLSNLQLSSLWKQADVLSQSIEHHLLGNHILANAKALFFAGVFFQGARADHWLATSVRLLTIQLEEQILPDGGHFERSPMYHAILLEDMLDLVNISRTFGAKPAEKCEVVITPMLRWLELMTHADGAPAHFNDSVSGIAATFAQVRDYASRLGVSNDESTPAKSNFLSASGYVRIDAGDTSVWIDVGQIGPDYQPGHAHCDCLSFELSRAGRRVIVNTGISTYNCCQRRDFERSTAAHNTVSLDGLDQNENWGAFRVGRRAVPIDVSYTENCVIAGHNGYRSRDILHRRQFSVVDQFIEISDTLEAQIAASGTAHFHCYPGVTPKISGNSVDLGYLTLSFQNAQSVEIFDYDYCEGFNLLEKAKEIQVVFEKSLLTAISA